jgi:hypothetical protein
MSVAWSAITQPALVAGENSAMRMPFFMHPMCFATAATASIMIIGTGVLTPVSLFMLLFIAGLLVLVSLLGILSLSGLTGLLLLSLVGLLEGLVPSTAQGD